MARDPYCNNCRYSLVGLTESSKCPECGKPLVEVLERGPAFRRGKRYRSSIVIFGLPLVHVALGPHEDEQRGRAKGIIAIGDVATGCLAIGGVARGIIAFGGLAIGFITFGGLSIGAVAFGGWAIGGVATGGGALGIVATGGGAVGFVAQGGGALGYYAEGGGAYGKFISAPYRVDPPAKRFFAEWNRRVGAGPGNQMRWLLVWLGWHVAAALITAALVSLLLLCVHLAKREPPPT